MNAISALLLDAFLRFRRPQPAENRHQRKATWSEKNPEGRWRSHDYGSLLQRDKVSLDLFWPKDESLEDSANLPAPDVIAGEIADDLTGSTGTVRGDSERLGSHRASLTSGYFFALAG